MGDRYWLWLGARLVFGAVIIWWAASYLGPGTGEKELQKTLDAMKRVRSVRVSFLATPGTQHNDMLWEVDCDKNIVHEQMHLVNTGSNPPVDYTQEHTRVMNQEYVRQRDGSWSKSPYPYPGGSATGFCTTLAQGTDTNPMPPIATMIRRGVIQKGDKKTVNGVRCREWLVTMKNGTAYLAHDTVCLGLDDHLPYEMTVDWEHSRSTYSDYNAPLNIDVSEAGLQTTGAGTAN